MKLEAMRTRYSASAQFFHWLSALLVGVAWLLGQSRDDFERGESRRIVDFVHVSSGQLIVVLLALRIISHLSIHRRQRRARPALGPIAPRNSRISCFISS